MTIFLVGLAGVAFGALVALAWMHVAGDGGAARVRAAIDDMQRASQSVRLDVDDIRRTAKRAMRRAERTLTPEQTAAIVTDHNRMAQDVLAMKEQVTELHEALRTGQFSQFMDGRRP